MFAPYLGPCPRERIGSRGRRCRDERCYDTSLLFLHGIARRWRSGLGMHMRLKPAHAVMTAFSESREPCCTYSTRDGECITSNLSTSAVTYASSSPVPLPTSRLSTLRQRSFPNISTAPVAFSPRGATTTQVDHDAWRTTPHPSTDQGRRFSTPNAMDASPLGSLPPELRNRIYELTAISDQPHNLMTGDPPLTRTCRQIRTESLKLYSATSRLPSPHHRRLPPTGAERLSSPRTRQDRPSQDPR